MKIKVSSRSSNNNSIRFMCEGCAHSIVYNMKILFTVEPPSKGDSMGER